MKTKWILKLLHRRKEEVTTRRFMFEAPMGVVMVTRSLNYNQAPTSGVDIYPMTGNASPPSFPTPVALAPAAVPHALDVQVGRAGEEEGTLEAKLHGASG